MDLLLSLLNGGRLCEQLSKPIVNPDRDVTERCKVARNLFSLAFAVVLATLPSAAGSAERVGEVVRVSIQVSGQAGALGKGDAIHRDERIRSNASGTGAFVLQDGTKLALGPNSSILIDQFVYRGGAKAEKLVIDATKGTFRWISGNSDSSAYQIRTPSGALSVRGTAFDVYIGADGVTAVALLNGSAEFCGRQGCVRLTRRCDFLLARPDGSITKPRGVVRDLGINRRAGDVFPFLTGQAGLPRGFKASSNCAGLGDIAPGNRGSDPRKEPTLRAPPPKSPNDPGNSIQSPR